MSENVRTSVERMPEMPRNSGTFDQHDIAETLIASIDQLHSVPGIAQEILRLTGNTDFDVRRVVACVEKDPAMVAKILRIVNSSRYGLKRRVTSVRQAVTYLGQKSLRMITLSFGLVDSLTRGRGAEVCEGYWKRALSMSSVCARISLTHPDIADDDAYTAGLLADIGVLILAQLYGDTYLELSSTTPHGPELVQAERVMCGVSHPFLGARLLEKWELPETLVEAVGDHHELKDGAFPLEVAVRAADLMADALWTPCSPNVLAAKTLMHEEFGMTTDSFIDLALECQNEIQENANLFGVKMPGSIDSAQLISEARRQHADASLETALEFDSIVTAFDDCST